MVRSGRSGESGTEPFRRHPRFEHATRKVILLDSALNQIIAQVFDRLVGCDFFFRAKWEKLCTASSSVVRRSGHPGLGRGKYILRSPSSIDWQVPGLSIPGRFHRNRKKPYETQLLSGIANRGVSFVAQQPPQFASAAGQLSLFPPVRSHLKVLFPQVHCDYV